MTVNHSSIAEQKRNGTAGRFGEKQNSAPSGELSIGQYVAPAEDGVCWYCKSSPALEGTHACSAAACQTEHEEEVALGAKRKRRAEELRWGDAGVREGARTPWGPAGHVTTMAPGVDSVSTAGHGGVKLSPQRNREVPTPLRSSSGWYEEDVEINAVVATFPDVFAAYNGRDVDEVREDAESSIRNWLPDQYERWKGVELRPGESSTRDRANWAKAHMHVPVVTSASMSEAFPDMVRVSARPGGHDGHGEYEEYLVPKDEYRAAREKREGDTPGRDGRFVVDRSRHPKLPPKEPDPQHKLEKVSVTAERTNPDALREAYRKGQVTSAAYDRITKDLNQRWRRSNGAGVETLRQILHDGVTSKTAFIEGSSTKYAFLQGSSVLRVSKSTWDYFDEVQDERSPADRAYQKASVYSHRLEQSWDVTPQQRAKEKELMAEADRLRQQEKEADIAANGTWEERDQARKARQAERERQATIAPS